MIQGSLECCWRAPAAHATSLFSGSVTSTEALYNAPPFGALRDDSWGAVTMGRFARRLGPLLFGIPGGGTWDMGHGWDMATLVLHTLAQKYLIELLMWSASGVHKQSPKV